MSIELIGSMLVFVALLITHKIIDKRKKLFILVLLLLLNILRQDVLLGSFVLGMIICFLQLNSKRYLALVSLNYIKIIFIIAGIYLASFPFIQDAALLNTTIYGFIFTKQIANVHEYFYVTGCSLILITALNSSKLKRFFSSKPFSFLGKISFGLYPIHLPLIFVISSRVYEFFYKYFYDGISIPLTFVISFACLLGISWLFYRFIDFYAIKWASKFAKFFWR